MTRPLSKSAASPSQLPAILQWTPAGRAIVFLLSASSIWCLLAEFYGLCSMRTSRFVFIPATVVLIAMALLDRARGDGRLWRAVAIGVDRRVSRRLRL